MGTKNNPGQFDCYDAAEPDEPMFVLLARDRLAAHLVSIWSKLRNGDHEAAQVVFRDLIAKHALHYSIEPDTPKAAEAIDCAMAMFKWRAAKSAALSRARGEPATPEGQPE